MSVEEKDNNQGITRRGAIKATGVLAAAAAWVTAPTQGLWPPAPYP
jgi:hypothetical protein